MYLVLLVLVIPQEPLPSINADEIRSLIDRLTSDSIVTREAAEERLWATA